MKLKRKNWHIRVGKWIADFNLIQNKLLIDLLLRYFFTSKIRVNKVRPQIKPLE